MVAQIGADGLDLFSDPRPELLADVARVQLEVPRNWVDIERKKGRRGFRSTQRLWISDVAEGVAVATWPAELAGQARYLYGGRLSSALVAAAIERGWTVEPSPHIAYWRSPPGSRLYMRPPMAPLDYVPLWEDEDALRRLRYAREDVEHELWPWLKQKGLADDGDDAELRRYLERFLRNQQADMRPGLRFRRVWTSAEAAELGSGLAETIRNEFDAVFAAAHEPTLSSAEIAGREAWERQNAKRTANSGLGAPYRQAQVIELPGSPEPFSVDPAVVVERGLRGHADTQNELADVLRDAGIEPRSPLPTEPNFDRHGSGTEPSS